MILTQNRADFLIQMPKKKVDDQEHKFPPNGIQKYIPLVSIDETEKFDTVINRKCNGRLRVNKKKCTYLNMYPHDIILARLDLNGRDHDNPMSLPPVHSSLLPNLADYVGQTIPCPHLHLYNENLVNWAVPAADFGFDNDQLDIYRRLLEFYNYCNVVEIPRVTYQEL